MASGNRQSLKTWLRSSVPTDTEFPLSIKTVLLRQGQSQRQFALQVGVDPTFLNHVIKGKKLIPVRRIDDWANKLDLHGDELEAFLEAAYLSHTPVFIRNLIEKLRRDQR